METDAPTSKLMSVKENSLLKIENKEIFHVMINICTYYSNNLGE